MSIQFNAISAEFDHNRAQAEKVVPLRPKSITGIIRLITVLICFLILSTLSVVVVARTGISPMMIEPAQHLLPGNVPPSDVHCGESADATCYPPVDAHCYEPGDANCFTSASIRQNGKVIRLTIDMASRLIAYTLIPVSEYTIGDLILTWGTPSGFTQNGRYIFVYWDARSAYLTTCSFRPESRVEFITYYRISPVSASPWRGFSRGDSKANKQAQICNS
jgi:hypothetical protein